MASLKPLEIGSGRIDITHYTVAAFVEAVVTSDDPLQPHRIIILIVHIHRATKHV